jgi:hypothetical protein
MVKTVCTTGHFNLICGLNFDECIYKSSSDSPVVAEFSPDESVHPDSFLEHNMANSK